MMKKILLILLLGLAFTFTGWSQDSIYLVNNNVIAAKITFINPDDIEYKKPNNFEGPTYRERKSNILRVRYSNGDIEFYEETEYFGTGSNASLKIERGEPATIVLLSDKIITGEIMDISNLCVVYKEKSEDENALVVMKSSIERIWKKDSSYSTFGKDGQEFKHPKPAPKLEIAKEETPTKTEDPATTKTTDPVKPKEELPAKPVNSGDKKENKGNCQLITAEGDFIDGKNLLVNYTKKTVSFIDQFGKPVTKTFKEVSVIKCPPNFISENLNEQ